MSKKKLSTDEAADYLGVRPNTLEVWRSKKKGPNYSKIGSRVLYDLEDLEAYFVSKNVYTTDTAPQLRMQNRGSK
ncbi:helix-turn-helix domain-containing protein [Desulfovibrio litoralis]|uniref:Helix-turn-helix domain-containing protein n=1 Tax=Desulfovibrio litoralis DSM 11393 TaxID=1121455 RepID=A0A1M7T6Y5_9BACT|nr:helix-turn-helix domain-containing protein [Desulfovibrio litoralis]SHN66476.1 Helix-turn-helix domain-containing protein [Desulfovibrio litoralis DSM 11393]